MTRFGSIRHLAWKYIESSSHFQGETSDAAFELHRRGSVVDDFQPHVLAIGHHEAADHRAVGRDGERQARERIDPGPGGEEIAQRRLDLRTLRSVEGDPQQAAAERLVEVLGVKAEGQFADGARAFLLGRPTPELRRAAMFAFSSRCASAWLDRRASSVRPPRHGVASRIPSGPSSDRRSARQFPSG